MLSVISYVFFIAMLVESFYEGQEPESLTLGVPRLNTRLAFYLYERAKLGARGRVNDSCRTDSVVATEALETVNIVYTFHKH